MNIVVNLRRVFMLIKRKNYDYELDFDFDIDFGYWALPVSICFIHMPEVGSLNSGFHTLLRIFCFQFSWEIWEWSHEVTDVDYPIGRLFDGRR